MNAHSNTAPVARRIAAITFALMMALTAVPAFADIIVYWNVFGTTLRVGTVATSTGFAQTEDGEFHSTNAWKGAESHMAIA